MKHKLARILIAGLVMMGYTVAVSGADWTTETKVEEALYQALHLIDTSQTIYIAKHPDQFYESAWAIGKHPSESRVIGYMALDAVGHAAVTATLVSLNAPRWLTRTWELVTIGDSAHCVGNNFRIGIKAQF
jgi:hypothetical protein